VSALRSFRTTFTPYSHTSALADGEVGPAGGRLEFIRTEPIIGAFGASRIAWGSNFPAAEQPLGALAELARTVIGQLPDADRDATFSGTARALYPALA
jgi:predicted TIM-barrel fold metal-dependent hydrolase